MSFTTWKKEFYPTTAHSTKGAPVVDAINHSLQKWTGLRAENLAKHGLERVAGHVRKLDGATTYQVAQAPQCALCVKFARQDSCTTCPLATNKDPAPSYGCIDQWTEFAYAGNPEPMIAALTRAIYTQGAIHVMQKAATVLDELATDLINCGLHSTKSVIAAQQVAAQLRELSTKVR